MNTLAISVQCCVDIFYLKFTLEFPEVVGVAEVLF